MATAFVLSGGANLGAAQVGMLTAVAEAGVHPDLVVGTSVGALNGAWVAAGAPLEDLGAVWRSLRRSSVFPTNPLRGLLGVSGRSDHLVSNSGLRHILHGNLRFDRLEDAPIPLHVVVTDVLTGAGVLLSSGPAEDSILASAAIPGVLPPVSLGDRAYMDGGVVNNSPISHAVELGADTVWVFATGYSCALRGAAAVRARDGPARNDVDRPTASVARRPTIRRGSRPARDPTAVSCRGLADRLQPSRRPDNPFVRSHHGLAGARSSGSGHHALAGRASARCKAAGLIAPTTTTALATLLVAELSTAN